VAVEFFLTSSTKCPVFSFRNEYYNLNGPPSIKCLSNANCLCTRVASGIHAGTEAVNLCPEWTPSEVADYVATYLRVAGFCALCSGLYVAVGASTH